MKKVLISLSFILSIFLQTHFSYAQAPLRNQFTVTASGNTVTATLSGLTVRVPETTISQYKYVIDTKEIKTIPPWVSQDLPTPGVGDPNNPRTTPTNGTVTWTIPHLKGNTLYHIRAVEFPPVGPRAINFATADTTVTTGSAGEIFFNEAKFDTGKQTLFGSIDITKHEEVDNVPLRTISIEASINKIEAGEKVGEKVFGLTPIPKEKFAESKDGKYLFQIIGNTPLDGNTWYYMVVTFTSDLGATASHPYKFNIKKGIVPETGKAADNFFDKNSYRLLAPIPGMVALLDPALCQLKQQTNPGQICDINAFLNFILKLIIGLAAVVLVVRIIIEGFGYMTTDIPFVKAKAKGNFKEALIGLVIALSSYLILNTINPRLVNNDVKIGVAEFEIKDEEDLGTDAPWTGPTIGLTGDIKKDLAKMTFPAGVLCPGKTGGSGDIAAVAKSFIGHVTYNNNPNVRGSPGPNGTIYLDCSLYTNVVLGCSGITPKSAPSTYAMITKGQKVNSVEVKNGKGYVNGEELHVGDLIGVNTPKKGHHVWIYVGDGEILDSQVSGAVVKKPFTIGTTGKSVTKTKKLEMQPYAPNIAPMNFVLRI